ncbi:MAG: potassium channel family protein [Myxococcota bacterium]
MNPTKRLLLALAGLATITLAGTLGYVMIEGFGWLDALYMTVITLSTVGFGEVQELGRGGQLFTVGLIIVGVALSLYLISVLAELIIEGRLRSVLGRRAMQRQIERMQGHVIVCGFGRFGRVVTEELVRQGKPVVVIELNAAREPELERLELPHLIGSGLSDETLRAAGLARAESLVIATSSEADSVFVTLSARDLAPEIKIFARGEGEAVARRLERAGATHVVSAYRMAGLRTALALLRPSVMTFLEVFRSQQGIEIDIEEIYIQDGAPLAGRTVHEVERAGERMRIIALRKEPQPLRLIPPGETAIEAGAHVIAIGERPGLDLLARQAQAGA